MKKIIAYIDRNYNLIFNRSKCVKIFIGYDFDYNDIISNGKSELRHLGNLWFKALNENKAKDIFEENNPWEI